MRVLSTSLIEGGSESWRDYKVRKEKRKICLLVGLIKKWIWFFLKAMVQSSCIYEKKELMPRFYSLYYNMGESQIMLTQKRVQG